MPADFFVETANTKSSVCHVSIGKMYQVFAMGLWKSSIELLLFGDIQLPFWYPAQLFSVTDPRMPEDWVFAINLQNDGGMQANGGYEKVVFDHLHNDALMEREPDAIEAFLTEMQRGTGNAG